MIEALLTALLDAALRQLPHEPNLHDKRALGQQARDDARSLADLGGPVQPADGDKQDLIASTRARLAQLDPVGDEGEFAVLTLLARRQERHLLELPPRLFAAAAETVPAREPFVEIGPGSEGTHAQLNRALINAEAAAITATETEFETTLALTELIARKLDETAALEAMLEAPWGSEPVDLSEYDRLLALAVDDRVEQLLREGGGGDEDAAV